MVHKQCLHNESTKWDLFALFQEDSTERLVMSQDGSYKAVAEYKHTWIDWQEAILMKQSQMTYNLHEYV